MLARQLTSTLQRLAASFPVVTITGPRQSGKTTLSRACFPDKAYVSLEDRIERAFAQDYIRAGQKSARFAGEEALMPWLLHGGDQTYERSGVKVMGWRDMRSGLPTCA